MNLQWEEQNITACLEMEPQQDEDRMWHHWELRKDGLLLKLTVWQYERDVEISIYKEDLPEALIRVALVDCPQIKWREDGSREWLQIYPGKVFERFSEGEPAVPHGVCLYTKPHIRLELRRDMDPKWLKTE